jgi:hypothetical protein
MVHPCLTGSSYNLKPERHMVNGSAIKLAIKTDTATPSSAKCADQGTWTAMPAK